MAEGPEAARPFDPSLAPGNGATEHLYARVIDATSSGVMITDARSADHPLVFVNAAFERLTGYAAADALGRNPRFLQGADTDPVTIAHVRATVRDGRHATVTAKNYRKDGTPFWLELALSPVRDVSGAVTHHIGIQTDVSERVAYEERLRHLATHDALTNLPNRTFFLDVLAHALVRAARHGNSCAVLFLDLDHFKVVNDSLGHAVGDRLLLTVAERLRARVRPENTVARLGGDEFALLLEGADADAAGAVAQEVTAALAEPVPLDGHTLPAFASIGIAVGTAGDTPEALLRDADTALYRAKEEGRSTFAHFVPAFHTRAVARLTLDEELRQAVDRGEFEVHYQPIVRLVEPRIVGMEALVRWQHPTRGLLPPGEFIGAAEATGLIAPLCRWVLTTACRQAKMWCDRFSTAPPWMAVNLSPVQLTNRDVVADVEGALAASGLEPAGLELELTESAVMAEAAATIDTLRALKDLGVRLTIDDFGTGYSSLAYLQRFPVDGLKIDRAFVSGVGELSGNTTIVEAVIALARGLDLVATAEGVETAAQMERLRAMGCELGQGWYFWRPGPPELASALLAEGVRSGWSGPVPDRERPPGTRTSDRDDTI